MSQRTDRIDELLREELAVILTRDISDPRIGFATITDVETTSDLSHAKVWVSVIGQPDERQETLAALGRAMPYARRLLGERLRLRRIPALHLHLDDSSDRGTRLLGILAELEAGRTPGAGPKVGESLPTPIRRLPHEGDAEPEPTTEVEAEPPTRVRRRTGVPRHPERDRQRRGRPR